MEMRHQIAAVGLGPVLFLQGGYVRRVTPRLPEPSGLRQGVAGVGPPLRLLIVGDSAAAGVGAATQDEALSGQLVAALAPDFRVSWKLVATTGFNTQAALQSLQQIPAEIFDVAVTSLGVNDVTGRCGIRKWVKLQAELVELLKSKFGTRFILLSGLPPMHVFPALPQPLRWYLGAQAVSFNKALGDWVKLNDRAEFFPVNFPQVPGIMASDGFHPGPAAYLIWARHLAEKISKQMASKEYTGGVTDDDPCAANDFGQPQNLSV
jgi:lysophospholipase L1-like esterase